jgi:glycosyltransferase involved in cell wall biosynthesis
VEKSIAPEMNSTQDISIARVIARLNVGGPAIQAILMTDAFRQRGYGTSLLTGEVAFGEASMEYLAEARQVRPIRLSSMSRRISLMRDFASLMRLCKIFRREKPTILHTHTAKAGALGRVAAIFTGVPIRVHTFHGHVFKGYFSPMVSRGFVAIERLLARHTDIIVAVSDSQKRELSEVFRIAAADKIEVVPLGFEVDSFLAINGHSGEFRKSLNRRPDVPIVGWVGRFAPIKCPELFLECAAECSLQSCIAYFVMAGDGELRDSCEALILAKNLGSSVQILGWRRDLTSIYSDVDVIVSTSANEGTPVALLEAMASGKPVIATDVGGTRDLMVGVPSRVEGMEIYENGILVKREHTLLVRGIRYLLDRPDLGASMGRCGREFVKANFSVQRLADDLERLYLKLARSKGILLKKRGLSVSVPAVAVPQDMDS